MSEETSNPEASTEAQSKDFDIQAEWAKAQTEEVTPDNEPETPAVLAERPEDEIKNPEDAAVETLVDDPVSGDESEVTGLGFDEGDETPAEEPRGAEFDEAAFDAETDAELKDMEGKERDKWKSLKAQLKEAKQTPVASPKEAELESKLEGLAEKAARVEELEALNGKLTEESYEIAVKASREYQDAYEVPVQLVSEELKALSKAFELDERAVARAIGETNPRSLADKIDALMPEYNDEGESNARYKRHIEQKVSQMATDYNQALHSQEALLTDAQATHEENQLARAEVSKAEQAKAHKLYKLQVKEITDEYAKQPVSDKNKEGLKKALAFANGADFDSVSTQNKAFAMASAAYAPTLVNENIALRKRIAELNGGKEEQAGAAVNLSQGSGGAAKASGKSPSHESIAASLGITVGA